MIQHAQFENVKGYASYANAQKQGEKVAARMPSDVCYRWVVIALPSGRFAPMVVCNQNVPGGPGMFLGDANVCIVN